MPRFNPFQTSNSSSSKTSSKTLHSLRSSTKAPCALPHEQESLFQLLTTPFTPDPCLYGPLPKVLSVGPSPPGEPSLYGTLPRFLSPSPPPFARTTDQNRYASMLPPPPPDSLRSTSALVPPGFSEKYVIHPRYKDQTPDQKQRKADRRKWGGAISFMPLAVPSNRNALGTPMLDCIYGIGLERPEERLFESLAAADKTHIKFVIMWPGYPQLDWTVSMSIYGTDSLLVTRKELANRIAVQYLNFAQMCRLDQPECQDPRWRVGPGGVTFDKMRLSLLRWVDGDIWHAFITVLTEREAAPKKG